MLEMVAVDSLRQGPHPGTLSALKDTGAVKADHPRRPSGGLPLTSPSPVASCTDMGVTRRVLRRRDVWLAKVPGAGRNTAPSAPRSAISPGEERFVQSTDERIRSGPARRTLVAGPSPPLSLLVEEARAGSARAFECIYRSLAGQVASYLRWHRATDPDGLTNDVFAQVHSNLTRFEGDEERFRSWLFTIAHHRLIDDRRRANRQPRVHGEVGSDAGVRGDVEEDAFAVMAHDHVRDLLAVLSPDQRDVVLLRVVADLSVQEVARLVRKREGAVKALQHRALASLRRHLSQRAG
jgi:RNA polymerase sigma factor (sigma-70 family)